MNIIFVFSHQDHSVSQERAVRATEKSLMELAGKAEEASEIASVSARQLPAKLETRTREVILQTCNM